MYKYENGKFIINTNSQGKPEPVEEIRATNHMLDKLSYQLATKQADGAGGRRLLFFNAVPSGDADSFVATKSLDGLQVTYTTDTAKSMGIAALADKNDVILASSRDHDATFKLAKFGTPENVMFGHYVGQTDKWVADTGKVTYDVNKDGTVTVTIPKFSVVKVSR
ncbi:MAG: hypothetical protein LKI80_06820 [Sporolactobacillus sp.]|nr:hypothetical protein [Sporolactobacillus sp.]